MALLYGRWLGKKSGSKMELVDGAQEVVNRERAAPRAAAGFFVRTYINCGRL